MVRAADAGAPRWEAHELVPSRWADFESLFRKYHGVQAGCWCMYYHRSHPNGPTGSRVRQERNRQDHLDLLLRGHAQGIVVYADGEPIGWCQFGRPEDLPRIEQGRKYRTLATELPGPPRWRITCFFVDRPLRRSGVAAFALHAALEAIRRQGGGVVEAYPATHFRAVATWFGSVAMFEREGFRVIRDFGRSNKLVRAELPSTPVRRTGPARARPEQSRGHRRLAIR